ncbi:MAG: GTP 3',8-cyclase MoaA [Methylococcales bacterium]|nr:GTP 3',8-cyclase MoaA [Methylococcales bacterium]
MINLQQQTQLTDRFGRVVNYLRVSITDRCDFRCVYCMAENMTFLPRRQILSLEEIQFVCQAFTELGVGKIRITGGEPLVRQGAVGLLQALGRLPLRELVLTSNGSHLAQMAADIKAAGVKRINISLDTLDPAKFKALTRTGDIEQVLAGINAARHAGFERLKINAVILKGRNHDEVCDLLQFAVDRGLDISFIEEMPLGRIDGRSRSENFYPGSQIREDLQRRFKLTALPEAGSGGPSVYYQVDGGHSRVGFISPHSSNFCGSCNRVRLTPEGRLLLCLGNEDAVDLKAVIRAHPGDMHRLKQTIVNAMQFKPEKHEFDIHEQPVILRHMSATGG